MYKISVIIPCYNYGKFVSQAIESIVSQNCDECELVVVDDGSTDNSWEIIQQHDVQAYRIQNGGARKACIYGLDRTTAPFVLFVDADDKLKPNSLRKILELLDGNVAKLQFSLTKIDAENNIIGGAHPKLRRFRLQAAIIDEVLKTGVYTCPPTTGNVFRRDVCNLLKEADYDNFVDGVTLFAAPFFGDIVSVPEELGYYRIHGFNDSGLGSKAKAETIWRDLDRFSLRMRHLANFIKSNGFEDRTFEYDEVFYYLERNFYYNLMLNRKPSTLSLMQLLRKLALENKTAVVKFKLATLFLALKILPLRFASQIIDFRFGSGDRSVLTFFRSAWSSRNKL